LFLKAKNLVNIKDPNEFVVGLVDSGKKFSLDPPHVSGGTFNLFGVCGHDIAESGNKKPDMLTG
jgi:hypothetical protein